MDDINQILPLLCSKPCSGSHFTERKILNLKIAKKDSIGLNSRSLFFFPFEKTIYFFPNSIPNMCFTDKGHYGSKTSYGRKYLYRHWEIILIKEKVHIYLDVAMFHRKI